LEKLNREGKLCGCFCFYAGKKNPLSGKQRKKYNFQKNKNALLKKKKKKSQFFSDGHAQRLAERPAWR
jgi:hypothetical protein